MITIEEIGDLTDLQVFELIKKMETEKSKILNAVKQLNKGLDGFVKELKESASGVPDDAIIAAYNNSIPPEYATSDITVALRSSRMTMNALTKQRVSEIKLLTEDIK